jgi:hypothetical protein
VQLLWLAGFLKKGLVNCDVDFGSPGYWLAFCFQALGAVSAESCGRDSFAEAAGFSQLRFGLSAEANDH